MNCFMRPISTRLLECSLQPPILPIRDLHRHLLPFPSFGWIPLESETSNLSYLTAVEDSLRHQAIPWLMVRILSWFEPTPVLVVLRAMLLTVPCICLTLPPAHIRVPLSLTDLTNQVHVARRSCLVPRWSRVLRIPTRFMCYMLVKNGVRRCWFGCTAFNVGIPSQSIELVEFLSRTIETRCCHWYLGNQLELSLGSWLVGWLSGRSRYGKSIRCLCYLLDAVNYSKRITSPF